MAAIAMAISLIAFFALFQPVFLSPIEEKLREKEKEEFFKRCPPFHCENFGEIGWPFTNKTDDELCGPFVVNGCDKKEQKKQIMLDRLSEKWYQLDNINLWELYISITDIELQRHLVSQNCSAFNYDLNLITGPNTHLPFHQNQLTLLKCSHPFIPKSSHLLYNYTACSDFNIFYNGRNNLLPRVEDKCSTIQLSSKMSKSYEKIFELLTATIDLQIHISDEYISCNCCKLKGGKCHQNKTTFPCTYQNGTEINMKPCQTFYFQTPPRKASYPEKNTLGFRLGLGLGLGIGVLVLLIFLCIVRSCYKRRKADSSNFQPSNSSSHSLRSDVELGNVYYGVPLFSYAELEKATNNFDTENMLGDGGFGTVYYGKLKDGREVAVKRLYENNYRRVEHFMNEIEILRRLRHKYLVTLYGCTPCNSRELLLVYEYIPNGTIADHLHGDQVKTSPLTWPIRMSIAVETATALAYLHASDIIHRDVKSSNILLDSNFCVKVADFGLSRLFPTNITHASTAPQGTPGYVDPEYHLCYQLTSKSDVYSFGVVLIELISSMMAIDIRRDRREINLANFAINKIKKGELDELIDRSFGYKSDEEVTRMTILVAELAFQCLQHDKELRPTMNEVLEELNTIQRGDYKEEEQKNHHTSSRAYYDEASLLKKVRFPASPNTVTAQWPSSSSTASIV